MKTNEKHELVRGSDEYILDREWDGGEKLTRAVIDYLIRAVPTIVIYQQKFTFFVNETDEAVTRDSNVLYYDGDLPLHQINYLRGLFKGYVDAWNVMLEEMVDSDNAYLGISK